MNGLEIAILVGVCVAFAVAVGIIIYNKIKGNGCDCGSCRNGNCPHCRQQSNNVNFDSNKTEPSADCGEC